MSKRTSIEQFIQKAKAVHGEKYDYSKVEYLRSHTKITIICSIHGEFNITPTEHLHNKVGCANCAGNKQSTTEEFIQKANKKHKNKFNYTQTIYQKASIKIIITCPIHGDFKQTPNSHLNGVGCRECGRNKEHTRITQQEFIQRSISFHGDRYDYSKVNYNKASTKVQIVCKKHGVFEQTPFSHMKGSGCSQCNKKYSKGELKISNFLKLNNILFEEEKTYQDLKANNNKTPLRFDFYLPDYNLLIEYDGQQHFILNPLIKDVEKQKKALIDYQYNDSLKEEFVKQKSISLLRINYKSFNKIEQILNQNINYKLNKNNK